MRYKAQKILDFFHKQGGISRYSSIRKAGFHPDILKFLEKEKKVEKIARGLYKLSDTELGAYPDFVLTSLQASQGVICLISALYFYEVTTEIPRFVNIAIPAGSRANKISYPPVKYYRFSYKAWESGIEEYESDGYKMKIYSLPKTIADCFKFRNKISPNVCMEAIKTAVQEKRIKPKDIMHYAKICRVDRVIKPILETLL
ncbi:MAG: hypothetical protein APR63_14895 [Desulfuromonas sp. SDB]|nr:MAG: hypothetical protein APR63_14895 [Desulfuromonas sp. SDB]